MGYLMIPIRELLSRIRRDKEFGQGGFIIGYYDRVEDAIIRLPLRDILVGPDDHIAFDIRGVRKDGELIWHRGRGK